jgi:nucleoid DNA-binding protein
MALTRNSLAEAIQYQTRLPKSKATESVGSIIEIIKGTLASDEDVLIR